jgi:hypothetical protein
VTLRIMQRYFRRVVGVCRPHDVRFARPVGPLGQSRDRLAFAVRMRKAWSRQYLLQLGKVDLLDYREGRHPDYEPRSDLWEILVGLMGLPNRITTMF